MCLRKSSDEIYNLLDSLFPNAKCELNYKNNYELLLSVVLSAQTTDVSVNRVTKDLFLNYPTPESLASAKIEDVKNIIKSIGLANTKAKNIIGLAKALVTEYDGNVPCDIDYLMKLPGVGRKTASVVLVEGFKIPAIPVDTHVFRVCSRLGISDGSSIEKTEYDIRAKFSEDKLCHLHHLLIHFGRYICKAKNPECDKCPFKD